MAMQNPFADNPAFDMTNLTQAISILPNRYDRITRMGIFPSRGINTTHFVVDERKLDSQMLGTRARGAPGPGIGRDTRLMRNFNIPHIPYGAEISSEEVVNTRPFGQESGMESLSALVTDRMQTMKDHLDQTLEYMLVQTLQGKVIDGAGVQILDLHTEFQVVQNVFDFQWTDANMFPRTRATQLRRWYEQNTFGASYSGLMVLTSPEFWDAMIEHPHIRDFYLYHAEAAEKLNTDLRESFTFGGLTFSEYFGEATAEDGTTVLPFIPANEAICFPIGANFFELVYAPADFNDTHNQPGQPYYARIEEGDFNRGWKIHTQTNPLPMCYRPNLLTRITMS